jgi:hypothetical protein
MHFVLAGFIHKQKLFEHVLNDFIELGAIFDQFEHFLIYFADVWAFQNALEYSHITD